MRTTRRWEKFSNSYGIAGFPERFKHPYGTLAGWNWHLWKGTQPCYWCQRYLEKDLLSKRRRFIMRWLGNGRYV